MYLKKYLKYKEKYLTLKSLGYVAAENSVGIIRRDSPLIKDLSHSTIKGGSLGEITYIDTINSTRYINLIKLNRYLRETGTNNIKVIFDHLEDLNYDLTLNEDFGENTGIDGGYLFSIRFTKYTFTSPYGGTKVKLLIPFILNDSDNKIKVIAIERGYSGRYSIYLFENIDNGKVVGVKFATIGDIKDKSGEFAVSTRALQSFYGDDRFLRGTFCVKFMNMIGYIFGIETIRLGDDAGVPCLCDDKIEITQFSIMRILVGKNSLYEDSGYQYTDSTIKGTILGFIPKPLKEVDTFSTDEIQFLSSNNMIDISIGEMMTNYLGKKISNSIICSIINKIIQYIVNRTEYMKRAKLYKNVNEGDLILT